jgi:hypothetical protein
LDPETTAFLESGCALVIGAVASDGEPFATRGWGLTVIDGGPIVRLLLDADDTRTVSGDGWSDLIAITAASVPTFQSTQLKGRIRGVEPASDDDRVRAARFCDEFFTDIAETDFTPRVILDRMEPEHYVACLVEVDEIFDQTPGPSAGARASS